MKIRELQELLSEYPEWYNVNIRFNFSAEDLYDTDWSDRQYRFEDSYVEDTVGSLEKRDITVYITNI